MSQHHGPSITWQTYDVRDLVMSVVHFEYTKPMGNKYQRLIKGTLLWSGRVTHLKRKFSKTFRFLLLTYLVYQTYCVVHLYVLYRFKVPQDCYAIHTSTTLSLQEKGRLLIHCSFKMCYTTRPQWSPFNCFRSLFSKQNTLGYKEYKFLI